MFAAAIRPDGGLASGWILFQAAGPTPRPTAVYPNLSLLEEWLPPYFSSSYAIEEFVLDRPSPWRPGGSHTFGELFIVIPDLRARLSARWDRRLDRLHLKIAHLADPLETEVQILVNSASVRREFVPATPDPEPVPVPSDTRDILVALVHRDGSVLARTHLQPAYPEAGWPRAQLPADDEEVARELESGENQEVEFKPFIPRHVHSQGRHQPQA